MKTSNKSSILTGTILLVLAALFSISLILQLLGMGLYGIGQNNFLYILGNVLYHVYGFSSILIPVFLFIAGISSFATKWTSQKTMRLLTAIIPFFTAVFTEKICRNAIANNEPAAATVKIIITIITGLMFIIIEILGAGIIAETVNQKIFYRNKYKKPADEDIDNAEEYSNDSEKVTFTPIKKKSVFDKALSKLQEERKQKEDAAFDELKEQSENLYKDEIPSIEDYENLDSKTEASETENSDETDLNSATNNDMSEFEEQMNNENEASAENADKTEEQPALEETPSEETEGEAKTPASIITQEEYAALINPSDFEEQTEQAPADELEWPTLPPKPAELPPEYTDFDENDPALEFPPKEDAAGANESEGYNESNTFEDESAAANESEDNPFAAARYVQAVLKPNPAYSSGISIHDDDEPVKQAPKAEKIQEAPKYPTKISLSDDTEDESEETEEAAFEPQFDENEKSQLSPDFFDIDMNSQEDDEELSEDISPIDPEMETNNQVFAQISQTEKSYKDISSLASNVFSDMDADIQEETGLPVFNNNLEKEDNRPDTLNPNANHARNLTADELTDFFNAQQAENIPQTSVIQGNPPKTSRATRKGPYVIPSDLLTAYKDDQYWIIDENTKQASINLRQTLSDFNIDAEIIGIKKGPVVTMFEILPAPGVKLSKIVALQDNIALSLAAQSVRIVAPIPGKQAVGIEVPNRERSIVSFREIIEMDLPEYNKMAVPVVLGKDILGKAQLVDLVKTPHMLIAGATGSGKSVCVNSLILSILYKRSYKDVKLILVDPKVVELKLYNNIPHLLTPVITEPKRAFQALQYCLCEMERRYALLDGLGVRDIASYNERIKERNICTEKLPYIVVIIDEFADLMATSGKELENTVARLTAMSRAVGIHLVLATQRPSVNVITGLIKANIPSRIAFMVASRTDSNIIIDSVGAEKLLGRGDMLYSSAVDPAPVRIQGTYISDQEVEDVVEYVKTYGEPDYLDDEIFTNDDEDDEGTDLFGEPMDDDDPLYDQALEIVVQAGKASASYIQRRLKIGYNRAARLVEEMEERGIVGPANGSKPREVIHIPS